jgi:hypothetical protein
LREWPADDAVIDDFDDKEGDDDVSEENPEREFESRKHAAIEVSKPRSLKQEGSKSKHEVLRCGWG